MYRREVDGKVILIEFADCDAGIIDASDADAIAFSVADKPWFFNELPSEDRSTPLYWFYDFRLGNLWIRAKDYTDDGEIVVAVERWGNK